MIKYIRIAVLEDVAEITEQLTHIISNDPELKLVSHYSSAEEALEEDLTELKIDVFLVDLGLPGMNGIDFIAWAKKECPTAQFLIHTVSDSSKDLMAALAVGAVGYVLKGSSPEEICNGLKIIAKGGSLLSPRMASRLAGFFNDIQSPKKVLTPTEVDILKKLKTGMTYAQVAEENVVSPHTIHTHVKNIYKKLNVGNRENAIKHAVFFDVF